MHTLHFSLSDSPFTPPITASLKSMKNQKPANSDEITFERMQKRRMGTRFKGAVFLHNISPLLPCSSPSHPHKKKEKKKKKRNKKRETQSGLVGRDDLKEETCKSTNKMLNSDHLDNIKVNQKHDLKKKKKSIC